MVMSFYAPLHTQQRHAQLLKAHTYIHVPRGVTRNIVGTHACPKNIEKGSLSDLRRQRLWEEGLFFSLTFDVFEKKGYYWVVLHQFRGRFCHQGLRHLGFNFEVLRRAWVPLQSASDPPPPPPGTCTFTHTHTHTHTHTQRNGRL